MDNLGNGSNTNSHQNIQSTFLTIEEILNSNNSSFVEKSTAWRQQSLIINSFNDDNGNDLMERHFLRHRAVMDEDTKNLENHLNAVQSLIGTDVRVPADATFPNIDEITFPTKGTDSSDLFMMSNKANSQNDGNTAEPRNSLAKYISRPTATSAPETFLSARQLLSAQTLKKNIQSNGIGSQRLVENNAPANQEAGFNFAATKKSLGSLGRVVNSTRKSFVSPVRSSSTKDMEAQNEGNIDSEMSSLLSHPALKNVDTKMVELINNEIIHKFKPVDWNEIAGLDYAKSIIKEAVVYPLLRPDIFTGLRRPPRGILLFGPPGTGKTLIGKCIASQSCSTFFSISSASLTSKWMGEGEKMVRALFAVAEARQPSVIFIDEIDSLLSQRSENENEGSRRLKTEFLVRLDGAATSDDDRVLIVGATNRPQELDEAVRRRFVKRLYVPLPEMNARTEILKNLLQTVDNNLDANALLEVSKLSEGYSGADMDSLCREASMEPLRSLPAESIITFQKENLRPVNINDFHSALEKIRPSVSQKDLNQYVEWNKTYGSSY